MFLSATLALLNAIFTCYDDFSKNKTIEFKELQITIESNLSAIMINSSLFTKITLTEFTAGSIFSA